MTETNEILLMQIKDMLNEMQHSFYLLNEAMEEDYKKLDERITKLETYVSTGT